MTAKNVHLSWKKKKSRSPTRPIFSWHITVNTTKFLFHPINASAGGILSRTERKWPSALKSHQVGVAHLQHYNNSYVCVWHIELIKEVCLSGFYFLSPGSLMGQQMWSIHISGTRKCSNFLSARPSEHTKAIHTDRWFRLCLAASQVGARRHKIKIMDDILVEP